MQVCRCTECAGVQSVQSVPCIKVVECICRCAECALYKNGRVCRCAECAGVPYKSDGEREACSMLEIEGRRKKE